MTDQKPMLDVYLAMPTHDGSIRLQAAGRFFNPRAGRPVRVVCRGGEGSLLGHNFNSLWCEALNGRIEGERFDFDYFVMLHADIEPEPDWLGILLREAIRLDVDVVSAVSPIKTPDGITSTGVDDPTNPWTSYRRLTVRELLGLPETFDWRDLRAAGMNPHGAAMLVNTGCMIVNLRKPWCRATDESGRARFEFTVNDAILFDAEGQAAAVVEPEDWRMSRLLHRWGCKVYATRKVQLNHFGSFGFTNAAAYGLESDSGSSWLSPAAPVAGCAGAVQGSDAGVAAIKPEP